MHKKWCTIRDISYGKKVNILKTMKSLKLFWWIVQVLLVITRKRSPSFFLSSSFLFFLAALYWLLTSLAGPPLSLSYVKTSLPTLMSFFFFFWCFFICFILLFNMNPLFYLCAFFSLVFVDSSHEEDEGLVADTRLNSPLCFPNSIGKLYPYLFSLFRFFLIILSYAVLSNSVKTF